MSDYIINFTDPANGSFVIKPYTTNGPASPAAATPLDANAVSANTSVVLLGKGMAEYGERFQESIVHMLEHFAFATDPAYPVQGQIWFKNDTNQVYIYDGTVWLEFALTVLGGNLDMNNFKIINLADPTNPQDAVNLQYADANYLRLNTTNDPLTADLTLFPNGAFPQPNSDIAASITYVNSMTLDGLADVVITAPTTDSFLRYDGADWIDSLIVLNDLADVDTTGAAAGEVLTFDGIDWVSAAPAAGTDRFLQSGVMNSTTLELTVDTSPSTLPVVVSVTGVAPVGHLHTTGDIYHDENPAFDSSYIRAERVSTVATENPFFPQRETFDNVVNALDQAIYVSRSPRRRRVLQGDGTTTVFPLGAEYTTYSGKLNVFNNGVKQYASTRGTASLLFDTPTAHQASNTGLAVGEYVIDAIVTGIPGTGNFQVVGDVTAIFTAGTRFSVVGSSANDGIWEVTTSTFVGPNTEIEVTATIVDGTADGILSVVTVDDYEFDIAVDTGDFTPGTTSTTVTVRPVPLKITLAITNVDIALDTFSVVGNYTSVFTVGRVFTVTSSTGNNGVWQVLSSAFTNGNTVITIDTTPSVTANTDITDPTIDGDLAVAYVSFAALTEDMQTEADLALANDVTIVFRDSAMLFIPDSQGNISTVELLETTGAGTDLFNTLVVIYTGMEILYDSYGSEVAITTIDDVNDEFDVTGDYTAAFPTGALFTVQGTNGFVAGFPITQGSNDGVFVVQAPGATFAAGVTTIPVTANLVAGTGGTIYFARSLGYNENGVPYDENNPGSSVTFATAPAAGTLIEVNVVP